MFSTRARFCGRLGVIPMPAQGGLSRGWSISGRSLSGRSGVDSGSLPGRSGSIRGRSARRARVQFGMGWGCSLLRRTSSSSCCVCSCTLLAKDSARACDASQLAHRMYWREVQSPLPQRPMAFGPFVGLLAPLPNFEAKGARPPGMRHSRTNWHRGPEDSLAAVLRSHWPDRAQDHASWQRAQTAFLRAADRRWAVSRTYRRLGGGRRR